MYRLALASLVAVGMAGWQFGTTVLVRGQEAPVFSDAVALTGVSAITADGSDLLTCGDTVEAVETPHMDLQGGCGTLQFTSTSCALVSDPNGASPEAGLCSIAETGAYSSMVCGTYSLTGSFSLASSPEGASASFTTTVVAGIGVMTGTLTDASGDGAGDTEPFSGVMLVHFNQVSGPLPDGAADCSNEIDVENAMVAAEPGLAG